MDLNHHNDLPIRTKRAMAQDIAEIVHSLHAGQSKKTNALIDDLKIKSIDFDFTIQQDVLVFAEAVQFQATYDPSHPVSPEVQSAADKLLSDLGLRM
jgi:hypothetical protein